MRRAPIAERGSVKAKTRATAPSEAEAYRDGLARSFVN